VDVHDGVEDGGRYCLDILRVAPRAAQSKLLDLVRVAILVSHVTKIDYGVLDLCDALEVIARALGKAVRAD